MLSLGVTQTYFDEINKILDSSKNDTELFEAIVNCPFHDKRRTTVLGLGFITFLLSNKKTGNIDRIKKTENELANRGGSISMKSFESIKVPLSYRGNIIAEAIRSGRYQQTNDWAYILSPDLNPVESRLNQANSGISCSFVYPFYGRDGGALIFHYFVTVDKITTEHRNFMHRYTKMVERALKKSH
jgi:hypothetical protein